MMRPATTTAAMYHAPGDLRLEEVPLPPLERGEMLIRVKACGLCPGEIMDWYMMRKAPIALGHEPVGEVVDVTEGVAFRPGDRVAVHHHAPCLACRYCERKDFVHCLTWRPRRLSPGGLATHAIVQPPAVASDAMRVPDSLSDDAATFVEPLACVVKSLRRARVRPGDRVLVIGLGVMGLLHLLVLRAVARPGQLIAADRVPERLAHGARLADAVLDTSHTPLDEGVAQLAAGGADVVIVCPGTIEALEAGRRAVAPGGTLAVFTPTRPDDIWPLRVHDLFFRETTLVPSYSAGPTDMHEAMRLLADGLPVESLITHRLPLQDAGRGYALVRAGGSALKVIVHP